MDLFTESQIYGLIIISISLSIFAGMWAAAGSPPKSNSKE